MFDLKPEEKLRERFTVERPPESDDWQIGLVVGPSGSGKSTLARTLWPDAICAGFDWPLEKAVIDAFPPLVSIKDITLALSAVGFSSPPSWLKPYQVLSNGERFRCELARALLGSGSLVVFDEFTSVVDRTVAKIGSAAVAKAIRRGAIGRRFVAVTCHYDVAEWLEPDWLLDMASGRLARGRLRRPEVRLQVFGAHRSAWSLFRRHHYLSGDLLTNAQCFVGFWGETPVGFSAWTHAVIQGYRKGDMREHRTVVLPDYQGLGIGNALAEFCASFFLAKGGRVFSTTSHPAVIHHRIRSPLWRCHRLNRASAAGRGGAFGGPRAYKGTSRRRITGGFEYIGPPAPAP
jgi:predicted ABC-type transport system involved in lysophospholipase L1 biosynthesis ATPase subunit/GNAT superfamily N-acetyltransferase